MCFNCMGIKMKLWSDDKTEDDIEYHANDDSNNVIYNLLEDIKCLKECNDELIELREFRDKAFEAHPNIDVDIKHLAPQQKAEGIL